MGQQLVLVRVQGLKPLTHRLIVVTVSRAGLYGDGGTAGRGGAHREACQRCGDVLNGGFKPAWRTAP